MTSSADDSEASGPMSVHRLVGQVANAHPDAVAVVFGDASLTYRQLNEQTDALAGAVNRAETDGPYVGISTTRGLGMVVGVLGILQSGRAYLPLDPAYPAQRLREIILNSGIRSVVATGYDAALFAELGLQIIDSQSIHAIESPLTRIPGSLAYILYTSGSTGTPKGVCMGHAPLLNLLQWQAGQSGAGLGTRTLQLAPLSFDVSFQEIFATLGTGGTLVLVDEATRLDLNALLLLIDEQRIERLFLPFVALQYLSEAAGRTGLFPVALREVMTAGEQLKITPQVAGFFAGLPGCVLFNQYGPTECHVVTQLILTGDPATWPALPGIGQPIDNVEVWFVDESLTVLPPGQTGELCLAGACLADGYLNQPDLTAEKFISLTLPDGNSPDGQTKRAYRTGDLGRFLPDGTIEFLGRRDDQVKIRGHRVELSEVEVVLNQTPGVRQAAVVARDSAAGQQIVAYLIADDALTNRASVRQMLAAKLPDYMLPSAFVWLDTFPQTSSGKIDRKRLPAPERTRPDLGTTYRHPRTNAERSMASLWGGALQMDRVGLDDNFFEMGGNSLLAQHTVALLAEAGMPVPVIKLYQFPTVAGLAGHMAGEKVSRLATALNSQPHNGQAIAIIGLNGRFPGAPTIASFWQVLVEGRETTHFFLDAELDATVPDTLRRDPNYVAARGILDDADRFDAHFFGLPPTVAQVMDPQQRIFLEIAAETLEQTGYSSPRFEGRVGVFAGCHNNSYYLNNVLTNPQAVDAVGPFQAMTLNEKDYIATRTAYQLNLTGPAVSVFSACSTSLLAIAQAVQSLRSGQCEVALAGGVSLTAPVNSGYLYQEGGMLSRDGHCRPFSADAQGTVFSDGAGIVLLKPLENAQRDGDTIWGVIKGVGVNNDGNGKGGFTAPSAAGQAGAIRAALADAQVSPDSISYVEAHGTATPIGDPIEIDGLTMAFGDAVRRQSCAIGSVKSNMGHLTAASGVAGLIKTVLAMHHRQLPASLHFSAPNPTIDFAASPFFVNDTLSDWPAGILLRAGVSSFGVGGTNVHIVLEEGPGTTPRSLTSPTGKGLNPYESENSSPAFKGGAGEANRPAQLLTWSAKRPVSLTQYGHTLADALDQPDAPDLADVGYTLTATRPDYAYRRFAVAIDAPEAVTALRDEKADVKPVESIPDDIVFMFPGQGAQFLNMGRAFYDCEPVFRQAVDDCADLVRDALGEDIRLVMYLEAPDAAAEAKLNDTRFAQPALFVTEYALAKLWMSWGIAPTVLCGHSIGEFVAAHLAGVFTLADALTLIATRGRLMSGLPRGSMLSVRMPEPELLPILPKTLSMAAVNSPKLSVVAGTDEAITDFIKTLDERGIAHKRLTTSHAFHSAMMEPILDQFAETVAAVALHRPQKPIISTRTGTFLTDADATSPHYWTRHLRETVRFADAVTTMQSLTSPLLLDIGPGVATSTFARQTLTAKTIPVRGGLISQPTDAAAYRQLLTTLGDLWQTGVTVDWNAFYAGQSYRKVLLPTYAFDKKRCWIDPPLSVPLPTVDRGPAPLVPPPPAPQPDLSMTAQPSRTKTLLHRVGTLLEDASGLEVLGVSSETSFLEIGFDSLLLTQVALNLKKEFGVPLTFRQLTGDLDSPARLVAYLDQTLPPDPTPAAPVTPLSIPPAQTTIPAVSTGIAPNDTALGLIAQQLALLTKQLALLQGTDQAGLALPPTAPASAQPIHGMLAMNGNGHHSPNGTAGTNGHHANGTAPLPLSNPLADVSPEEAAELKKPFGATARIDRQALELTPAQQDFLTRLIQRYNQKTAKSKAYAQQNRAHMADPRVVTGFRPLTKEIVYPLVVNRSKGSRLWDIDGNEYIDSLNGFGSNMLGYQSDVIKAALHDQIESGFEVGPQHELAGEVTRLICDLTGSDRAALCSTGSEAVLGAMRVARTVTGRSLIVAFTGSYHGINDEVLVRGTKKLKSFPAAPGIMPEAVANMLILDYGTDESLRIIRERAHELAAVLVEPVQSRRPEFVPIDFLKEVRSITAESGTALIFDEVITGFRMHPGGVQALFGIRADLATYGKVVGGGIPIGVIAGKRAFMDALDGGFWQYGNDSVPEVGVTYFAGTFVRHPLALAAASVSLTYMKERGPALQQGITQKAQRLADALNAVAKQRQLPLFVAQFGSLWKIKMREDVQYGELLFTLMREKNVHIWDGFPCFMTEAHTDTDVDTMIRCFTESADELIGAGFLGGSVAPTAPNLPDPSPGITQSSPVPNARLGRDPQGNPAWFLPNPDQPGKYVQVMLTD